MQTPPAKQNNGAKQKKKILSKWTAGEEDGRAGIEGAWGEVMGREKEVWAVQAALTVRPWERDVEQSPSFRKRNIVIYHALFQFYSLQALFIVYRHAFIGETE